MSDRMRPIPFQDLMEWILKEKENKDTIFGVKTLFQKKDDNVLNIFNEKIETPFGPAAGPNTQLAQNIIASYITGCRFFELKTVQTLDGEDLPVAKPCIIAEDECYNVEWSTELTVPQAYDEYVKAWFVLKVLSKEYGLGEKDGFVFNMSVGYDFEGISSPKIDKFIEGLKDASKTDIWNECQAYLLENLDKFKGIDADFVKEISPAVCTSITLSTLHGCPPQEIEKIASYLLKEKKLNTYVKCNPTMLGYEYARETLNKMGYDYVAFDDFHFKDDLQFEDAVPMIKRLQMLGEEVELAFGVKITNTFPVKITRNELPGEEMYMSGRSLYPLSISLAYKLAKAFDGKIKMSYSGGADAFNIDKIFNTGIWPITMATTFLKPGGYQRGVQIADKLSGFDYSNFDEINVDVLEKLVNDAIADPHHIKPIKPMPSRKMDRKVPLVDCFVAPCKEGCPIGQDIPAYVHLVGEGKHLDALKVIVDKNPLPFITGTICSHKCMTKCTRNFYEESVKIRDTKLEAAKVAFNKLMSELSTAKKVSDTKIAIIGGGPAGLAAAYFLGRSGMDVTIFEKKNELGGIVKHVIPEFRISSEAIQNDIDLVSKMGVKFELGQEQCSVEDLKAKGYKHILFAVGAWKPGMLNLEGGQTLNVIQCLERLKSNDKELKLGKNVVVVGGGNTAMDVARAAKKADGVENVYLVYRRTKKYMPADEEELVLALEDGVEFKELLSPIKIENGVLKCSKMVLGEPDESGRRKPIKTDEVIDIPADTVVSAVGEKIDDKLFTDNGIKLNERGRVIVDAETFQTNVENVYVAGDALRGPATVVEAIADATRFAKNVINAEKISDNGFKNLSYTGDMKNILPKKGILKMAPSAKNESERCLECSTVCENCVDVCPNRANIAVAVEGKSMNQIVHVDSMCNECGNCKVFCPYESAPYKDKFTVFSSEADFNNSENEGFVIIDSETMSCKVRLEGKVSTVNLKDNACALPKDIENIIWAVIKNYSYLIF
jgi:putative selenate reductase